MHLFYVPDAGSGCELPPEEAHHAVKVLRMQPGDEITLTDGKGFFYKAVITLATSGRCLFEVQDAQLQPPLWSGYIHIALAPTKNMERLEWLAEKATEIGVDELTFLNCRFSERKTIKTERIRKILVAAMKQSLKSRLPRLNELTGFSDFIGLPFDGNKFIAHCREGEKPYLWDMAHKGESSLVLIGPEGDFSVEEIQQAIKAGFEPVSLSNSRLRTETAALAACHILNIKNQ